MTSKDIRPLQLGFIAGTSYCGSTLTSFLLNSHPDVFSPGEMGPARGYAEAQYTCSCGMPLRECPFYVQVSERIAAHGVWFSLDNWSLRFRYSPTRLVDRVFRGPIRPAPLLALRDSLRYLWPAYRRIHTAIAQRNGEFIRACLAVSGKGVFLDATKTPQRIQDIAHIPNVLIRVIHLVRNPFAFCNSMRRNENKAPSHSAHLWKRINLDVLRYAQAVAPTRYLRINYETLCSHPIRFVEDAAEFLGAKKQPSLDLDIPSSPHHIIGNRMRLNPPALSRIRPDNSWQKELSTSEQREIWQIVHRLALEFGYEAP